ncbi:MAG: hypothetical protein M3540_08935 [Actinomycetota bacterium]|nr:hypothetical protein [Actinomycetota bacterium]
MHERAEGEGLFEIRIPGHGFGLEDFKTMARISEDFGVGLRARRRRFDHAALAARRGFRALIVLLPFDASPAYA